jgi:hypothetical protein
MPSGSNKRRRRRIAIGRRAAEAARQLDVQQKGLAERREMLRKEQEAQFLESLEGRSRITKDE